MVRDPFSERGNSKKRIHAQRRTHEGAVSDIKPRVDFAPSSLKYAPKVVRYAVAAVFAHWTPAQRMCREQRLPGRHMPYRTFNKGRAKRRGLRKAFLIDLFEDGFSACIGPVDLKFAKCVQREGSAGIILCHAEIEHCAVQRARGRRPEEVLVNALLRLVRILRARGCARQQLKNR